LKDKDKKTAVLSPILTAADYLRPCLKINQFLFRFFSDIGVGIITVGKHAGQSFLVGHRFNHAIGKLTSSLRKFVRIGKKIVFDRKFRGNYLIISVLLVSALTTIGISPLGSVPREITKVIHKRSGDWRESIHNIH